MRNCIIYFILFFCIVLTDYNEFAEALSIYPNPSSGSFTINYNTGKQKNVGFELMDIYGRAVFTTQLINNSTKHQIFVSETIANGVYVGRVVSEKGIVSGKFILQR